MRTYRNRKAAAVAFPIGGIGAGSIGLAGNGTLVDFEICNRPNRESINGFSGFAVRTEEEGRVTDLRFLRGDTLRDFMGGMHTGDHSWGFGHGPSRATYAGMKHFRDTVFSDRFPIAEVSLRDPDFPGAVHLSAWNPFIPSNDRDSSLPVAFFDFTVRNTAAHPLTYTFAFLMRNPFGAPVTIHSTRDKEGLRLTIRSVCRDPDAPGYGEMTLLTDAAHSACQTHLLRGGWFDSLEAFVSDFSRPGDLQDRTYADPATDDSDICVLTASCTAAPGECADLHFILTWYVPNCVKYWDRSGAEPPVWKNYYATLYGSSDEIASDCCRRRATLLRYTERFGRALRASTLPAPVKEAVCDNLAILKSSACLRLTDGTFYGWEGVARTAGSCEGTCQHVWNYAYALPYLFPALERSVRTAELTCSLESSGLLHFRLMLPPGSTRQNFRACVDGQMGTVMKCYREWKISGDTAWLKSLWPRIRCCIEYAWSPENPDRWDPDRTGVISGRQHHTLDMELFGVHAWLSGFYICALNAGAEMAAALGEEHLADQYRNLARKGAQRLEQTFNGDYYEQELNLTDASVLSPYGDADQVYLDRESGEIKYQIGKGCEIDQVLAAWHADLMGLPPVFDPEHRAQALRSIFRNNFLSMRQLNNPCRVFACDDECGTVMCSFAPGNKPRIPIPYAEEVMTGFEYAFACNLLQCGMEEEAVTAVRAVRARYDGERRNPYAEIECGASYARAMASFSLLHAYSGYVPDLTQGALRFSPLRNGTWFFAADRVWGTVQKADDRFVLRILYGHIALRRLTCGMTRVDAVTLGGQNIPFEETAGGVSLSVTLTEGQSLILKGSCES